MYEITEQPLQDVLDLIKEWKMGFSESIAEQPDSKQTQYTQGRIHAFEVIMSRLGFEKYIEMN